LTALPEFTTPQSRGQLLELAGLGRLAAHIDLNGSAFVVANQMVGYLGHYGRMSWEHEALGLLINLVKTFSGLRQQEFLTNLLLRYDMMTPLSPSLPVTRRATEAPPEDLAEKIITSNTLRPIAFLDRALTASRAVAHLVVREAGSNWSGTGFLLTEDLMITNHHVLPDSKKAASTVFRFNYQDGPDGRPLLPQEYYAKSDGMFHTNSSLDYSIVELSGAPGRTWGSLEMAAKAPALGDRVNIIQHPGGQPKQIAMQSNLVEYGDEEVLQYLTATLPGSSGSPVLTDDWQVYALHHAGGHIQEPSTGKYYFRNEGIVLSRVLDDLPDGLRSRVFGGGNGN
jgi:V8-like Glu-specific endopeptidase